MQEPEELPERDSKSDRKRQMLALQKIGETLVSLSASELAQIPLESPLDQAIHEARSLKSHEAKRRQLQYIGKLMRNVEIQPIEEALNTVLRKGQLSKAKFHQVERWRDQLIQEGDVACHKFIEKHPAIDVQQLRQLVRNAQKHTSGAETALFRFLREFLL